MNFKTRSGLLLFAFCLGQTALPIEADYTCSSIISTLAYDVIPKAFAVNGKPMRPYGIPLHQQQKDRKGGVQMANQFRTLTVSGLKISETRFYEQ